MPGLHYPVYRLAIMVAGLATAALLWLLVDRTRFGMLVRAGASNGRCCRRWASISGGSSCWSSASAPCWRASPGRWSAPILSVEPGMGDSVLILAFVVIVIGGIGSVRGAFLAALLVGLIETLGRSCCPT